LPPQDSQVASQELNGSRFGGIGAIVEPAQGVLQVDEPLPNTPAARAGMRAGDLITRIDGRAVSGMTSDNAIARIHGRSGSVVHLTVVRAHGRPFKVAVKRAQIPPITAYGRVIAGRWGYLRILSFGDSTSREVSQTLNLLRAGGAKAIILDLRENPGGYVDAAQRVVSQFVRSGIVAYEQDNQHHLQPLSVIPGAQATSLPLVVLVDSGTASAAEITAGALRDDRGAVLIGTRTYGKGSMQSVYPLSDGSTVRITDRLWLTPHRQSIQKVGLKPDIPVTPSAQDAMTGRDVELLAAEKYLSHHVTH
jgi:carboxyl-terminal processing protease